MSFPRGELCNICEIVLRFLLWPVFATFFNFLTVSFFHMQSGAVTSASAGSASATAGVFSPKDNVRLIWHHACVLTVKQRRACVLNVIFRPFSFQSLSLCLHDEQCSQSLTITFVSNLSSARVCVCTCVCVYVWKVVFFATSPTLPQSCTGSKCPIKDAERCVAVSAVVLRARTMWKVDLLLVQVRQNYLWWAVQYQCLDMANFTSFDTTW